MKYNEIMENIEVTSEMRERILTNISKRASRKTEPISIFRNWKLLTTMAACAAIVILCVTMLPNIINTNQPEDGNVAVVNGIIDCENLEELAQKAGFEINELTNIPFEVSEKNYSFWFGTIAQIDYRSDNNTITYRVAKGKEDISGDYNDYSQVREEVIGNNKVTIKGNDDKVYLAIWNSESYSYAISSSEGITLNEMLRVIGVSGN